MLKLILTEHGKLPEDIKPIFANTGKEMEETLDFVEECSQRWSVPITWVEYRKSRNFEVVDHKTASRKGEPYEAIIEERSYLPNPIARFCTVELKIRTMHRYLHSLGWEEWTSCVGMRADEPRRVAKLSNPSEGNYETRIAPLAKAGVTVQGVGAFWKASPFDLRLPNMNGKTMHGNCDLCFLKGENQVVSLIREEPRRAIWWIEQEAKIKSKGRFKGDGARFRNDRASYQRMYEMALSHGELFGYDEPLEDCFCNAS